MLLRDLMSIRTRFSMYFCIDLKNKNHIIRLTGRRSVHLIHRIALDYALIKYYGVLFPIINLNYIDLIFIYYYSLSVVYCQSLRTIDSYDAINVN